MRSSVQRMPSGTAQEQGQDSSIISQVYSVTVALIPLYHVAAAGFKAKACWGTEQQPAPV